MTLRRSSVYLMGAVVLIGACADPGPTATDATQALETVDLARPGVLSGLVVTTVRALGGTSMLGTIIASDTNTFRGTISRSGVTVAVIEGATESAQLTVALAGGIGEAPAVRTISDASGLGRGRERTVESRTVNGGPTSLATYRRGGTLVATIATDWAPVSGGWLMVSRTVTAFRDGKPVHSVEFVISGILVTPANGMLALDQLPVFSSSRATTPPEAAAEGGGDCEAEFDAMFDALDAFGFASAAMLSCLAGPWTCLAATFALGIAARNVDVNESRLDRCLAL